VRKRFLTLILLVGSYPLFSQTREIDSIRRALAARPVDTNYVKDLVNLSWLMRNAGAYDSCLAYTRKGRELAERTGFRKQAGKALTIAGIVYMDQGEYDSAQVAYMSALRIRQEINDKKGIAAVYNNLGNLYELRGDLPRALQMQLMGLKIREEIQDKKEIAMSYNNIGNIYDGLKNYDEALKNFQLSIRYKKEINDVLGMAMSYGNIGRVYQYKGRYDDALANYRQTLAMEQELGYAIGQGDCYNNIGQAYQKKAQLSTGPGTRSLWLDSALANYMRAMQVTADIGDKQGLATSYSNLGSIDLVRRNYAQSEVYLLKALALATQLRELSLLHDITRNLSEVYAATGRHREALQYFKQCIAARDSVNNEANTKKTVQLEMQYAFDKKEAAAKVEQEKKDELAAAETRRQRIILLSISGFGLLVLGFAVFAYRSLLQKKRANEEITRQKYLIEEKQKEILDSIYYARRIQRSLLTSDRYINRHLSRLSGIHGKSS
jgi:tetratricopeptide (TPR) repeat protein